MGLARFELATHRSSADCSPGLSYSPIINKKNSDEFITASSVGFEPTTPWLRARYSTN